MRATLFNHARQIVFSEPLLAATTEFNLVYNINFALLYLLLSVSWMILRNKKILISIRKSEILTLDGLLMYVFMALVQSACIALVENWLVQQGFSMFNLATSGMMLGALAFVVWLGDKSGRGR